MTFPDGNLIPKDIDSVSADVVDLTEVDDIGAMDFEEGLAIELFFHILQGAVGHVVLGRGNKFNIVAHAFKEKDVVFPNFYQLIVGFNEKEFGVGLRGSGVVQCGLLSGCGFGRLLLKLIDRFEEAFVGKWFFQVIVDVILKGVEGIFGFGSSQDDHRGIGKAVEQLEAIGAGHFDVEEKKVNPFPVEVLEGVRHVEEMPFDFDEVTFFAELAEEIRGDLDVFYYDARKFHVLIQIKRSLIRVFIE